MDVTNKALIEEIVKRVEQKLGELEGGSPIGEEVNYTRRLLSEKDIVEHNKAGIKKIVYSKNTIVTDVAKDYAKNFKIELIEQN
ncbi:MAG: hypothetical protein Q4E88_06610 [Coriobacteriia bacterium]|nr:hypothetical protein [Coriobacteriia bacterium]